MKFIIASRPSMAALVRVGCAVIGAFLAISGIALARGTEAVPEIDPGSIASAIALVMGGTAVLRGRIRR